MSFRSAILVICALGLVAGTSGAPPARKLAGTASNVPKSWFLGVDAAMAAVETVSLGAALSDSLSVRYGPRWDSGIEIDRVSADGTVTWRCQVEPLNVEHSRYHQEVTARVDSLQIKVKSVGAKTILATIDVDSGKLLSRLVVENAKKP